MQDTYGAIFDAYAEKTVTKTDKSKAAYVPTADQCSVLALAAVPPTHDRVFDLKVLDAARVSVKASYYHSERATDPTRKPEPRMGRELISSWLNAGETLILGLVGGELFAAKRAAAPNLDELVVRVAKRASPATILARAARAKGPPARVLITRNDYKRDPFVVQAALLRADGECEMPACSSELFERADGEMYLEVHHILPLRENGEDTLRNVAAICPRCHRELHFGKDALLKRARLRRYIETL